jgi:hypothetical protein
MYVSLILNNSSIRISYNENTILDSYVLWYDCLHMTYIKTPRDQDSIINNGSSVADISGIIELKLTSIKNLLPRTSSVNRNAIPISSTGLMVSNIGAMNFGCWLRSSRIEIMLGSVISHKDTEEDSKIQIEGAGEQDDVHNNRITFIGTTTGHVNNTRSQNTGKGIYMFYNNIDK